MRCVTEDSFWNFCLRNIGFICFSHHVGQLVVLFHLGRWLAIDRLLLILHLHRLAIRSHDRLLVLHWLTIWSHDRLSVCHLLLSRLLLVHRLSTRLLLVNRVIRLLLIDRLAIWSHLLTSMLLLILCV